MFETTESVG